MEVNRWKEDISLLIWKKVYEDEVEDKDEEDEEKRWGRRRRRKRRKRRKGGFEGTIWTATALSHLLHYRAHLEFMLDSLCSHKGGSRIRSKHPPNSKVAANNVLYVNLVLVLGSLREGDVALHNGGEGSGGGGGRKGGEGREGGKGGGKGGGGGEGGD
ncbi:hypothetical protein V1477_000039 [Vespula maculifrons]|uniref:Uncharacterized protein n=1 Tax=Vespula maculifrons TaxID=7453 RepID=A0ABD2D3N8_VESMC